MTHASPAGAYAHTAQRDWENDAELAAECAGAAGQRDIAHQLVHSYPGNQFKVITFKFEAMRTLNAMINASMNGLVRPKRYHGLTEYRHHAALALCCTE